MSNPRIFHLEQFPDNIYIFLENKYRKNFFETAIKVIGSKNKLSKLLNIHSRTLFDWYNGCRKQSYDGKIHIQYMPLFIIKKLSKILVKNGYKSLDMKNLEKYVLMYRTHSGNPVKSPKIPLKETPELASLLMHLIADGSAQPNRTPHYFNTRPELLDEFEKNLRIFGNLKVIRNENEIYFSKTIADIMRNIYNIDFSSKKARVPEIFKYLPKSFSIALIRAFIDDEGSIGDGRITFHSINKMLLNDIKELLNIHFPEITKHTSNICTGKGGSYFYIKIGGIEYYQKSIGLTHKIKSKYLRYNIKRLRKNKNKVNINPRGITKKKIVDSLKKKPSTIKNMSIKLGIRYITTQQHFRDLKNKQIIKIFKESKKGNLWCVK